MYEIWDSVNLLGISFEIIGFVLLLPGVIRWLGNLNNDKLMNKDKEILIDNVITLFNQPPRNPDKLREILSQDTSIGRELIEKILIRFEKNETFSVFDLIDKQKNRPTKLKESLSLIGVIMVIIGLIGQFASVVLENGLG